MGVRPVRHQGAGVPVSDVGTLYLIIVGLLVVAGVGLWAASRP